MSILLLHWAVWAQDRTVTGKVLSASDNSPLPGVAVVVKGTTNGTVSDIDGNYKLILPQGATSLVFSFIGFQTKEVEIGTQTVIDVVISEDVRQLDEVVVTGYGSQIKQDVTSNIAKVSGKDIQNLATLSVESTMQGRAAGVLIESGSGKVGQGMKVRVRGSSSITAGNQPVYVIDGVVVTSNSQSRTDAATNPLADINFNDIESIEVLKDAASAAIYGSRGSNGVVIITTKQGKSGKTKFNINYQTGRSGPTNKREFLSAKEYVELYREGAINRDKLNGLDPVNNPDDYPGSRLEAAEGDLDFYAAMDLFTDGSTDWRQLKVDTDWQDEVLRNDAGFQQVDLSASGGNEKTRFYLSGAYSSQEGILIGNKFERMSGRINLDHSVSDKFKLGFNLGLSRSENDRVAQDNEFSAPLQIVALPPISPIRKPDGSFMDTPDGLIYYNTLIENAEAEFITTSFRNIGNTYASYQIIPGLTARGEFGIDLMTQNEDRWWSSITETGRQANNTGSGDSRWVQVTNVTSKAFLNYSKVLNTVHSLDVTGGTEFQSSRKDETNVEAIGIAVDDLRKLESAATPIAFDSKLNEYTFLSYFGRINYKFNDKYLLSVSGRADASSRFGENNRFGFFPAASLGWIISEEAFLKDNNVVSFLKTRLSYGITGNAEIGNYDHLGTWEGAGYAGNAGLTPKRIPNPDLTWEKASQLDLGLDFGFFKNRISGEVDYFIKKSSDLLLDVPVPGTTGFEIQTQNIGKVENKGFEFVLNTDNMTGDFKWKTSLNLSFIKNKVTDLGGQDIIDEGSSRYMNVVKVGEPIGVFYGAEYAGVNPTNGDGIWFVNDTPNPDDIAEGVVFQLNGAYVTNNYNLAKFTTVGNPNPTFFGGITNTLQYKGLDFSFMFQWVSGNQIHMPSGRFMSSNGNFEDNQTRDMLNRWQKPGDITDVPQLRYFRANGNQARSSRYVQDGDYLRLKTLTIGYNLPKNLVQKAHLDNARIYITAQNLLTFTPYEGWDPEVSADFRGNANGVNGNANGSSNINQGIEFYTAPQARTITFGINLGF
jgi:TonB-linked SusC/RagA family outer membrane protein